MNIWNHTTLYIVSYKICQNIHFFMRISQCGQLFLYLLHTAEMSFEKQNFSTIVRFSGFSSTLWNGPQLSNAVLLLSWNITAFYVVTSHVKINGKLSTYSKRGQLFLYLKHIPHILFEKPNFSTIVRFSDFYINIIKWATAF